MRILMPWRCRSSYFSSAQSLDPALLLERLHQVSTGMIAKLRFPVASTTRIGIDQEIPAGDHR